MKTSIRFGNSSPARTAAFFAAILVASAFALRGAGNDPADTQSTARQQARLMGTLPVLPASWAKPVDAGRERGFTARFLQAPLSPGLEDSTRRSEAQLAGQYPIESQALVFPDVINYDLNENGGRGNFGGEARLPRGGHNDNLAAEVVAYLQLTQGTHRFGVNSDDGFRLTAGQVPGDLAFVLGEYSGGRGASDTQFDFQVEADGLYAFRLTWEQGTGGANLEWFSVDQATGARTLINDPDSTGAVVACRYLDGAASPVNIVKQPQDVPVVEDAGATFLVEVTDGSGATNPLNLFYQWQKNGENIAGANRPAYTTPPLTATDHGSLYRCVITLPGYLPVTSTEATFGVLAPLVSSTVPANGATGVAPTTNIRCEITNRETQVQPGSIRFWLNDTELTQDIVLDTTRPDGVSVNYTPDSFLVFDTLYTAKIEFQDGGVAPNTLTFSWQFRTMGAVPIIPAGFAKAVDAGRERGFTARFLQAPQSPRLPDSTGRTEEQLAGLYPIEYQAVVLPDVINYDLNENGGRGNFGGESRLPRGSHNDNLAAEVVAYLKLGRGLHRLGVNSDDGFRLTAGQVPGDLAFVLGEYSGGRGASDTQFDFLVEGGGLYAFRLTWEQGAGDANLEWFSVDPATGVRTLINDPNSADAVAAFRYVDGLTNPASIAQQPQSAEVFESTTATFSVKAVIGDVTNPATLAYQWQANGVDIPGAYRPSHTTPILTMAEDQTKFRCLITLPGYPTLVSDDAILTVKEDTTPPQLVSGRTMMASGTVWLQFAELLNPASIADVANYRLSYGGKVVGAALRPDGKTVALSVADFSHSDFTATVNGVQDLAGNNVATDATMPVTVLNLESQDVGSPGDPLAPGSVFASAPDEFEVVAGGSDIWNNADQFYFVFEALVGDFDLKARVARLDGTSYWAKGGIMARETLYTGSRNLKVNANPVTGNNGYEIHIRDQQDGPTGSWPGISNNGNAGIPNAWLRLKREGDIFTAFRSSDGAEWAQMAQITSVFPGRLLVGLCTSSVNNSQATTAWYGDYGDAGATTRAPQAIPDLLIKKNGDAVVDYALDSVYQLVPHDQQIEKQAVTSMVPAVFDVKVKNNGAEKRAFVLWAAESQAAGWNVHYFSGTVDITEQIVGDTGYTTLALGPNESEIITVKMTAGQRVPAGGLKSTTIRVFTDQYSLNVRDAVEAVAETTPFFQPDLLISRATDLNYAGNNVYNADGAGQTKSLGVEAAQEAVYSVQLENDGNLPAEYVLTGTPGGEGWTVNYYAARTYLQFDGGDDVIDLGSWSPGTQWSVEAWAKASSTPSARRTIAGGFNECRDWGVTMQDGQFGVAICPPGTCTTTLLSGEPVQPNVWYYVAATCDGTTAQLYVNGALKNSGPVSSGYWATAWPRIGSEACCSGNSFPGGIREVRIWDHALTIEQIQANMHEAVPADSAGLLGYWKLDEGYGTAVHDLSPNARHGEARNGPVWIRSTDQPKDLVDITSVITGEGHIPRSLNPGETSWLVVKVTPDASVAGDAMKEVRVQAATPGQNPVIDTVVALTRRIPSSTTPVGGLYTTTLDFESGKVMVGVEARTTPDQLQLTSESYTFPFIWVPNSNEGTISKVDTRTGRELGRYRVSPRGDSNPSRTTVDLRGNCWVANRQTASVVKVGLLENGQYADRNGNGIIETSRDINGDGNITGDELLPWGQDECVLIEIALVRDQEGAFVPGTPNVPYANDYWNPGSRGIAVDALDNVWLGTYGTRMFYYVDGTTGAILRKIDVSSAGHTSYGALITPDGIVWSAGQNKNHVLKLNPADNSFLVVPLSHYAYGLGVDKLGHVFVSGWQHYRLSRINHNTDTVEWTKWAPYEARGLAVTDDGDVWMANSGPGVVTRWSNNGIIKATIPVGNTPTGVSVDAAGKVWVVNNGDEYIKRIDPAADAVDLEKRIVGGTHYGYSDMTGIIVRNTTTRLGFWSVVHNARTLNAPWGTVSWHGEEPQGTSIQVRARSSNDQATWSVWETAFNGLKLNATPPGKYLEVEVTLRSSINGVSPVLYDLTAQPATEVDLGELVYQNDFQGAVGTEWSANTTDVTPTGARRFLGQFGNQNVSLTLADLPPHSAVSVVFDLFVIRSWDGNSEVHGPDIWELNVAGGLKLLNTTFNNGPAAAAEAGQAYPQSFMAGKNPPRTGASENNTLGFVFDGEGVMDSVYSLTSSFPHTADTLVLNFLATGLTEDMADESWGLDNIRVYITPEAAPLTLVAVGFDQQGQFGIQLFGEPQKTYVVEASEDLVNWTVIKTEKLTKNPMEVLDAQAPLGHRFYKAKLQQ